MLETINLTKKYEDGHLAVDHLSFKVEPGEIFCMFGASLMMAMAKPSFWRMPLE